MKIMYEEHLLEQRLKRCCSSGKAIDCIVITKTGQNHYPTTIQSTTSHCMNSWITLLDTDTSGSMKTLMLEDRDAS